MSWPLTRPFAEAELYKQQLDQAITKANNSFKPRFAIMQHTVVYQNGQDRQKSFNAIRGVLGQFENLMRKIGNVDEGFPNKVPLETLADRDNYNSEMLEQNLMFGSPEKVIAKLQQYQ